MSTPPVPPSELPTSARTAGSSGSAGSSGTSGRPRVSPGWIGRRVTVRRPAPAGHLADALGDLVALDDTAATIETARGPVDVALAEVVAARLVEPTTPEILALERVSLSAWRPTETELSPDGWVLRANSGRTGRANSALALTTPRRPLPEVVTDVRAWYAERGLPLRIAVPLPARSLLDGGLEEYAGLVADAREDTHVFTARLDRLLRSAPPASGTEVRLADAPDAGWFSIHLDGAPNDDPVLQELVGRHDHAVFASIVEDDVVVAIGRATVDTAAPGRDDRPGPTWLSITGLAVHPDYRRHGLARQLLTAVWTWGVAEGATRSWLQVRSTNQAAIRLYLNLGYWHHHDYRYRYDPSPA